MAIFVAVDPRTNTNNATIVRVAVATAITHGDRGIVEPEAAAARAQHSLFSFADQHFGWTSSSFNDILLYL